MANVSNVSESGLNATWPKQSNATWLSGDEPVNAHLLDGGLILYIGFLVLFVWRGAFFWKFCGLPLKYANYCSLLLLLLLFMIGYDLIMFVSYAVSHAQSALSEFAMFPDWLQALILSAPFFMLTTYATVSFQTFQHMDKISNDSAVLRHDRAVQIILLPVVYGTTSFTSLTRLYRVSVADYVPKDYTQDQLYQAETCVMVGDLYEAWTLYQFGQLTLELIEASITKQGFSENESERAAARALMVAHKAVESLAWVGILSFVIVCVMESGATVYIMCFLPIHKQLEAYTEVYAQFYWAGFIISCIAIYNVFIVESNFHNFLGPYSPWLKFLTVKFLVTFAYFQRCTFDIARVMVTSYPGLQYIPFLGDIMTFNDLTYEVFYGALMVFECFTVSMMHLFAWNHNEEWYDENVDDRSKLVDEPGEAQGIGSPQRTYGSV